ncbi:hypothetical protein CBD41_08285 [bacterium TMED181]|nr:hypothetical protein [Planctomycetota bacterium]OUW42887.1 MAG: hypothetical protein CBD41_08285 [bacterium TMED181]
MQRVWLFVLAFLFWGFVNLSGTALAQDASFSAEGGSIPVGGSATIALTLDNSGQEIQGWSLGICSDPVVIAVNAANSGADTETSKNGGPPDFNQIASFADGVTQGVVLCFTGCAVIADVSGFEMLTIDYQGLSEVSTTIDFCNTLGSPPVETVIVVNGASVPPTQNSGSVNVVGLPDPEFTYSAGNAAANYNPADGNASVSVGITISEVDNSAVGAVFPSVTQGFSMGLGHGPEVSATALSLSLGFDADFAESNLLVDGWTLGVVYSFTGGTSLTFESPSEIISVDYSTGGSMAGNDVGTTVALNWSDALGSPPVANVVVVGGGSYGADLVDGSIALNPVVTVDFIRGDVNGDSIVNIADAIWIIYELFLNGPATNCPIASDANNDGVGDLADTSFIIMHRFMGGAAPAAPFPDCGQVSGQAPEDCAASSCL